MYDLVTASGGARTVKSPLLQFTVTGLASSTPYEFRFCAVNELGCGPWSKSCAAVATPLLGRNLPKSQALLTLDQWLLRMGQNDPSLQVSKQHYRAPSHTPRSSMGSLTLCAWGRVVVAVHVCTHGWARACVRLVGAQALLLAAKEAELITAEEVTAMRRAIRRGLLPTTL